ncbi:MAG: hypothetical protein H6837_09830 [Planctomycetes bacterium]|nr:hypothetical protein [Planctomycetota bacterium]
MLLEQNRPLARSVSPDGDVDGCATTDVDQRAREHLHGIGTGRATELAIQLRTPLDVDLASVDCAYLPTTERGRVREVIQHLLPDGMHQRAQKLGSDLLPCRAERGGGHWLRRGKIDLEVRGLIPKSVQEMPVAATTVAVACHEQQDRDQKFWAECTAATEIAIANADILDVSARGASQRETCVHEES